jgi:hypothetical protein
LLVADIWLMRRYANRDPKSPSDETGATAAPAMGY